MKKILSVMLVICMLASVLVMPATVFAATTIVNVSSVSQLQSEHNYSNNLDKMWVYTHPTEAESLCVTFSSDTKTEPNYDYIYIYDGNDTQIGKFDGTTLAGKTINVPGNEVKICLTSDVSYNYYGFRVTAIVANGTSGSCGTNVTWTLYSDGTLTISGTGAMTDYASSSSMPWYSLKSSIKKVVVEDGVTRIGSSAFYRCSALTSITIPDSVTSIGDSAFYGCHSLTSITIPDSVTSVGSDAFSYCYALESVTTGNGVTGIGSYAFSYCDALTSVTIGISVTSIGNSAFRDCDALTSITIPDSVTSIGYEAFYSCSALKSVTIGNGVTSIGSYAFENCVALTSITIPDSVTSIGSSAFSSCSVLKA